MIKVFGIKNCDTIKKALKWLDAAGIAHEYHDFRKDGLDRDTLKAWLDELGWETVINKRGTTWRQLSDDQKANMTAEMALEVALENPAIIKRPVFDLGSERLVGFNKDIQARIENAD